MKGYMGGFQEEVESKRKVVKLKAVGLPVELVIKREDQNLVGEQTHLKEEREDADLLVPLVKHIKEGRGRHELGKYFKNGELLYDSLYLRF